MSSTGTSTVPAAPYALLVEAFAVAGRRLRQLRRAPARLLGVTLSPLVSLVVFGYLFENSIVIAGGGNYQEYLFAGAAVQVGLAGIDPTGIAVAVDRQSGLMDRLRSMPIFRSAVLIGHTLADLVVGLMSLGIVTLVGLFLGWRPQTGVMATVAGFALVAVFIYVMLWVGVLFGMTMKNPESISSIAQFMVILLPFLSNAFLSARSVPELMRPVVEWNPLSVVMTSCRHLWGNVPEGSVEFSSGYSAIAVIVTLAVLLVVVSSISLRRFRTVSA